MNRYEAILLDKMVELKLAYNEERAVHYVDEILVLLDCICDFREPPRSLDVGDGYGAMAAVDIESGASA